MKNIIGQIATMPIECKTLDVHLKTFITCLNGANKSTMRIAGLNVKIKWTVNILTH